MTAMYRSNNMKIVGTGGYAPVKVLTNEALEELVDTNAAWVENNLGIKERRVAAKDESTSDLATRAASSALEQTGLSPDDIDLLIVATATPDRKAPSTACLVKHKLGIANTCPAFDIAGVCSGFIYGLSLSSALISSGAHRRILLIGADTFSKITDWNRRDCVFFGDGAGAVILEHTEEDAFFSSKIFSDCRETDNFTVYPEDSYFTMNGRAVYETGTSVLPQAITEVLEENDLGIHDVDLLIPHQPSIRLLQTTAERLGLPFEKVKRNMDRFANTSGATIPLLFDEVFRSGELKTGNLLVFAAVGSGWTWGAGVYRCL